MKSNPKIILLFQLLLVLPGGCGKDESAAPATQPNAAVTVRAVSVVRQAVDNTVDVVGTLYADERVTIAAKVPGRVVSVSRDFGDRVSEGQPLARIESVDYELIVAQRKASLLEALAKLGLSELPAGEFDATTVATVRRAKAQADNAKARTGRANTLYTQSPPLISSQDFADIETASQVAERDYDVAVLLAQADLAAAKARQSDVDAANRRLADASVNAPQSGKVARENYFGVAQRNVSVGSYVREGDPLFELVADDPLKFRASVPERFVNALKVNQPVRVVLEAGVQVQGKVTRISPSIDVATRTFEIEASIANADRTFRPGSFGRATIVIGQDAGATFVPRSAVASFAGIHRVFGERDGKAVEYVVQMAQADGDLVQVTPALKDVQTVLAGEIEKLSKGVPVNVLSSDSPAATLPAETKSVTPVK